MEQLTEARMKGYRTCVLSEFIGNKILLRETSSIVITYKVSCEPTFVEQKAIKQAS